MTDRLKIFRMFMPFEFVLFDHNPESIKVDARPGARRWQEQAAAPRAERPERAPQPERWGRSSTAPTR